MKNSLFIIRGLGVGTAGVVIVMAVARYYIWNVREASLALYFMLFYITQLHILAFGACLLFL